MAEDVEINILANDRGTPAWKAQADAVHAYLKELSQLDSIQKANERSAKEYDKAVQKVIDEGRTAQERYNVRVGELDDLLKQNKITQDQYNRSVGKAKEEFDKATSAVTSYDRAARQAIEQGLTPLERYNARVAELDELLKLNKLTQDQYNRAIEKNKADLDAATESQNKYARAAKQVTEEGLTKQERYNRRVAELKDLLRANAITQEEFNRSLALANARLNEHVKAKDQLSEMRAELGGIVAQWVSIGAVIGTATSEVRQFMDANKKAQQDSETSAKKQERLAKRFQAQGGLSDDDAKAAQKDIMDVALGTATSTEGAFGMATALTSTGFDPKVAQKEALLPMAKLMKAQTLDPSKAVSEGEMAEFFSKFLAGSGQEKSGANVEKLAIAVQGLKATPLKITDLGQLAKQAAGLKALGNMSPEEMLSNFAFLTQTEQSEEAGTHMKEVVRQLATAKTNKKAVEYLKKLGLKPTDVDFVGEDFATVLQRMQGGLSKVSEADRKAALDVIIEGRNIAAFETLANGQKDVAKLRDQMNDKAGFEADVKLTTEGRNAAQTRQEVEKERLETAQGSYTDLYRQEIANQERARNTPPYLRSIRERVFNTSSAMGYSPEQATQHSSWNSIIGALSAFTAGTIRPTALVPKKEGSVDVGDDSTLIEAGVKKAVGGQEPLNTIKQKPKPAPQNPPQQPAKPQEEGGNKDLADKLTSLINVLERKFGVNGQPQKVEIVNSEPTKFIPGLDPSPAAQRPAALLEG